MENGDDPVRPQENQRGSAEGSTLGTKEEDAVNGDEGAMLEDLRSHEVEIRSKFQRSIHDRDMMPYVRQADYSFTPAWLDLVALGFQVVVRNVLSARRLSIFKIGITTHAPWRMFNAGYGYAIRDERYDRMDLLVASLPAACAYLERVLIAAFRTTPGCRNVLPGGESAPKEGPCFVYLVSLPEKEITRRHRSKAARSIEPP